MPLSSQITTAQLTVAQLARSIGLPGAPVILDVRLQEDVDLDDRFLPASIRRDHRTVEQWAGDYGGRTVVVVCQKGKKLSHGTVAWLRHAGVDAATLEGGFEAWRDQAGLLVAPRHLPPRDAQGRTVWVTRARPKVDRIACPWLIRRFIDPQAVFLFVPTPEVLAVAERFNATPFDLDDVFWSHRGERCSFDTMIEAFGLQSPALDRLAMIVRGADTARLDLAPQAAGLLAAALGYSAMFDDDVAQLAHSLPLYDAFYRWCRDASAEAHNWPAAA